MDDLKVLGRAEYIAFPEVGLLKVPARIDTGAKTSSIFGSAEVKNGKLEVIFKGFHVENEEKVEFTEFDTVVVASSTGQMQRRYKVRLLVSIGGKKIRAWFTIADRSTQVYPVLIGRNVLLGKFIVNVKAGRVLLRRERDRSIDLQASAPKTTDKENE